MQADKVWLATEANFSHIGHQLVSTVTNEHFKPLTNVVESYELVFISVDALDQDIVFLIFYHRAPLYKLVSVLLVETNLPAPNLVCRVIEEHKVSSTDNVADLAVARHGSA